MSLNLIQCRKFNDESCDDVCSMQVFNWRSGEDERFCMWALLEECDDYRGLETSMRNGK